jgi:hypothetical protein
MEILTSKGSSILIDDEDENLSHMKWCVNNCGYAVRTVRIDGHQHTEILHRVVMGLTKSDKRMVDHINGNRLDNRKSNLRIADHSQNACNSKLRRDNTTGKRGVHWHARSKKFIARVRLKNREIYLGCFDTLEAAAEAYEIGASQFHGEFKS